jgi:hypothetical protein
MSAYTTTEAPLLSGEPRTPPRHAASNGLQVDTETMFMQETYPERRTSTLRLDTRVAESLQSGFRRVSPSSDSPASSTSTHSRQDSTASYTPLRSARGSLSLGVSIEAWVLLFQSANETNREPLITQFCHIDLRCHILPSAERLWHYRLQTRIHLS